MSDTAANIAELADVPAKPRSRRRRLLLYGLIVLLALGGIATGYLGYWSPRDLWAREGDGSTAASADLASIEFPALDLTLPDARPRRLHLLVTIEAPRADLRRVEAQIPRMRDSFIVFLTGIAPAAFERRGILDVVRDEMSNRARLVFDDEIPVDVLIQEFVLK